MCTSGYTIFKEYKGCTVKVQWWNIPFRNKVSMLDLNRDEPLYSCYAEAEIKSMEGHRIWMKTRPGHYREVAVSRGLKIPFKSMEWSKCNFPFQYQYIIKPTGDDNKGNHQLHCIVLIYHQFSEKNGMAISEKNYYILNKWNIIYFNSSYLHFAVSTACHV